MVSRIGKRRQVVLPKAICDELGVQEGDFIQITTSTGSIVIRPKKLVDPDDVLTVEDARAVLKGERQLKRGEYVNLDQLEHELDRKNRKGRRKTA